MDLFGVEQHICEASGQSTGAKFKLAFYPLNIITSHLNAAHKCSTSTLPVLWLVQCRK